jgi:ribosomal protein S18 acetylase RimI-like enzyme
MNLVWPEAPIVLQRLGAGSQVLGEHHDFVVLPGDAHKLVCIECLAIDYDYRSLRNCASYMVAIFQEESKRRGGYLVLSVRHRGTPNDDVMRRHSN